MYSTESQKEKLATSEQRLSGAAKVYLAFALTSGLAVSVHAGLRWPESGLLRFLFYASVAGLASRLKVKIPGVEATLSVSFFFSLLSAVDLGYSQAIAVAVVSGIMQSFWRSEQRPKPIQIVFAISTMALSAAAGALAFGWDLPVKLGFEFMSRMALATAALFAANAVLVGAIVSLTQNKPLWDTVRGFSWSLPGYLAGALLVGVFHALSLAIGWQSTLLCLPALYLVYRSYQIYVDKVEEHRRHAEQMSALHLRTIEALALAIEAKDETTHEHLGRVQVYALEVGRELGLGEADTEALRAASLLHDIGKLAVPEHIINKPGKLTPDEFEKMKIHPSVGAEILETVQFPYPVVPIVRGHHEKWDGTGYPDGLKGEEIPIGARVIAAVDCLDALASDRQYRRAMPLEQAMEIVLQESGRAFDPRIVGILAGRYQEYERKAREQTVRKAPKLSLAVKVGRGEAPAAGFENLEIEDKPVLSPAETLAAEVVIQRELWALVTLIENLGATLRLEETLALAAIRVRGIVPYCGLAGYVLKGGMLEPLHVTGEDAMLFSSLRIPVGQGLSGWVAENRKPIINGNPSVESGYLADPTNFSMMRSALSVPMVGAGKLAGVLTLYSKAKNAFSKTQADRLETICASLGALIEKKHEGSSSQEWMDRLDQVVRRCRGGGLPVSVVVGTFNGLHEVKSRFGVAAGDELVRCLTERFSKHIENGATHLAGDGFAIVLPGISPENAGDNVLLMRQTVREAGLRDFGEDLISLSVGVSGSGGDAVDFESLIDAAVRELARVNGSTCEQATV